MPIVSRTEIFNVEQEKLYDLLIRYEDYPEFMDGVSGVEVLERDENGARVEYSLNIIKKFRYILNLQQTRPTKISWSFESGDIFKKNEGSWALKNLSGGRTEVTYTLDVDIKGLVPKTVVKMLTQSNLPSMLKAVEQRAQDE